MTTRRKLEFDLAIAVRNELGTCPGITFYWWSNWAIERLLSIDPQKPVAVGLRVARIAMKEIGAMSHRSDASPLQPAIGDLYDLVLGLGPKGARWAVNQLQQLSCRVAESCQETNLEYALVWDTQYSDLCDYRCGFRVLVAGDAKFIRRGDKAELKKLLRARNPWPLVAEAFGEGGDAFVESVKNSTKFKGAPEYGYGREVMPFTRERLLGLIEWRRQLNDEEGVEYWERRLEKLA